MTLLASMIATERIPHALLFCGTPGIRGTQLGNAAKQFATELLGQYPHPDIHDFLPEGKNGMHPIQNIRSLIAEVGFVPYQAKWKLFIVHAAERMLPTSANALLKTLEEPTDRTIIILLSQYPDKLLPTILSRCQRIEFSSTLEKVEHPILDVLAGHQSLDSLKENDDLDALFETILLWYRDRMLLTLKGIEAYLSYPEHQSQIAKTPFVSLERVEKLLVQARLGCERSIKLSTCLEMLFFQLSI